VTIREVLLAKKKGAPPWQHYLLYLATSPFPDSALQFAGGFNGSVWRQGRPCGWGPGERTHNCAMGQIPGRPLLEDHSIIARLEGQLFSLQVRIQELEALVKVSCRTPKTSGTSEP